MLSVLAIIVPLIVLVIMIWKKVNIAVSAIVCTGLMALMSGLNIYDCLTNDYMEAFVGYIKNYWPLIFLGASFGKAMQLGGGAEDLANLLTSKLGTKFTIAVLCVTTLILSYGGVSCYVIVFVMYPIALNMFKKADLPRHLIPGDRSSRFLYSCKLRTWFSICCKQYPCKISGNICNSPSCIFRDHRRFLLPAGTVLLLMAGKSCT